MFKQPRFTLEQLVYLYEYDPELGVLRAKIDIGRKNVRKGEIAGNSSSNGKHIRISILGERYALHRVIWFLHTRKWPELEIDHIDGNPTNNRIENLREVSHLKNMWNQIRSHKSNKTTGVLGVCFVKRKNKYQAQIIVNNDYIWLGYFETEQEAAEAYNRAKSVYHT